MEESIKNRAILILAILTAIFFMSTIGSCGNVRRLRFARDTEMTKRLDLEENMTKFMQEKTAGEAKIKTLTQQLEEEKAAHEATKKALEQEQLVSQGLNEDLQKVTKLKDALEEDLKEALVKTKSTKVRP